METIRSLARHTPSRDALARWAENKWVAIALVVFVPGGIVLPIVYAAIRLSRSR